MAVEGICTNVGTKLAEMSVDKAIQEAGYLCCHQSYVDDFDEQRKKLSDVVSSVSEEIKDARDRNETRIDPVVQGWLDEANDLSQQDTKAKKKCFFGLCINCIWQNRRSKELQGKTQKIKDLITDRGDWSQVGRPAELVGIEFYSSPDFMHFESRKLKFEELKKELKDVKNCLIGLQGMGGTGKTTMAIQVGKEFQQLKVFDKVIFSTVSNANQPADVIKIRCDIARHLGLRLDDGRESEHAEKLMTRIAKGEEKILIILDDVWDKELSLKDIGIALGQHEKGRCCVLITTRNLRICREMGCRKAIQLETISEKDALNLFLSHSGKSGDDDSSNTDFKEVALHIVNECGRLPVAIVPLARALNSEPLEYWNDTLTRLQKFDPMSHDVHEDLIESYKSLSLSYDNLKDSKAQKLFLLCSLFPEDFEIPVELLTRIAIGMGLCGEDSKYSIARSQVSNIQRKLFDSCLLSKVAHKLNFSEFLTKAANKCVKMHDLIREVALSIAKEEIQVVMNSKSTLKENIQWSSWNIDCFPDRFDGAELQFLLLMIKAEEHSVQVPDGLFKGVMNVRVLLLICTNDSRIRAPSLMKSTLPLVNIQTLSLSNWELGDISVIGILQSLETLELIKCSITELPGEVAKLKKLRLVGLRRCRIESKNPFKVIERCPILEELYYVRNEDILCFTDELDHIEAPATLEKYHIVTDTYKSMEVDDSISRWFQPRYLSKIFSKATFKSLASRAEILELGIDDGRWTNVIPGIDPMEGMKNLIKLSLKTCQNMKSLIHLDHRHSDVIIFSKLVELELYDLEVEELFRGPLPVDLLKKLEVLKIEYCDYLEGTLLKGKLELGNLRSIRLRSCRLVTFLFDTSTGQSLKKLEEVSIEDCDELEYIFGQYSNAEEGSYQIQNQVILPSLKKVEIWRAPKLSGMFPAECCDEASCIVRSRELGEDDLKEKDGSKSDTYAFSWAAIPICCFFPKSTETLLDHTTSQSQMLIKAKKGFNIAGCLMRTPLNPSFVTIMTITYCSSNNLTSLFTLAVASSMSSLEVLYVEYCNGLKHIVSSAEEGDGDDHIHMNHNYSIFPNLRKLRVWDCEVLEDVFPASHCTKLHHLEQVTVCDVPKLRYVFGKCSCQNHNVEILLPALKELWLRDAPDMVNICTENCFLKALSLQFVTARKVPQHVIRPLIDFKLETQDISTRKVMEMKPENLTELCLEGGETDRVYDLEGLQIEGPVKSRLNVLHLEDLPLLTDICVGTRNILSFQNLGELRISGCKRLQFIFSASILRSLPQLKLLKASKCPELLQVFEEDTDENSHVSQHNCFRQLREIHVEKCDKLKCLFSITECGILPNLEELRIEEAPELMQVFGCKQGVSKELKHVFPKLSGLQLHNLESLESVCQGIDFQMVPRRDVRRCPKFSLTSTTKDTACNNEESRAALSQSMSSPPYISEEKTAQIVEDTSKRAPNMTHQIQEIKEAGDDENGSKLNNSITPYQTNIISEQSKSTQNESPQNVELSGVGEVPSLTEKDNKQTLSTCPKSDKEAHGGTSGDTMIVERKDSTFNPIESWSNDTTNSIVISNCLNLFLIKNKSEVTNEIVEDTSKRSPNMTKDMLVDEEAKKETKIMDQQAPTEKGPDHIEVSVGDDPPLEKDCKPTSSTSSKLGIKYPGQDAMVHEGSKNESTTMGQRAPAKATHDVHSHDSQNNIEVHDGEGSSLEKDNEATSSTSTKRVKEVTKSVVEEESANQEQNNGPPNLGVIMANQKIMDEITKADIKVPQQFEKDDLIRLFQIMEEGADMEVHTHHISNIAAYEEDYAKVAKAFVDLETSMKMNLNEIANSEEIRLGIQNALNFLSTHCFEDGTLSHGLKSKVDSLQHKIQTVVSSFKQASTTIHTFTELQGRENYMMNQEFPQRKESAVNLVSEIDETEKSMLELKEFISRLQFELYSKEKEMKECETKLASLQEKKKKSVWDTMKFMKELEDVKNDRSQMEEDQIKARRELENSNSEWSTCVADLRKTITQLGIYLNHKI